MSDPTTDPATTATAAVEDALSHAVAAQVAAQIEAALPGAVAEAIAKLPAPIPPTGTPATMAQTPSVGRIVHYYAPADEESAGSRIHAAMITGVAEDGSTVDLAVFPRGGMAEPKCGVIHRVVAAPSADPSPCWDWPTRV